MAGPLWTVVTGHGAPLVLLHGNGESHRVFDRLVPLLAPHRTLVGIDSRGHGDSPLGAEPLRIATMADDVAAAMTDLGLARAPVLGFSDGGNIALELALRHPEVPGPLVLVGANLYPAGMKAGVRRSIEVSYAVVRSLTGLVPRLDPAAQRLALMVEDPDIDPADLARIDQPVLVVTGEHDLVLPGHTALIASSLPRPHSVVVPDVGHMVPHEAPDVLATLVLEHLARVAG